MYDWLRVEFWWLVHNVIAHPICGVLNLVGSALEAAGLIRSAAYPMVASEIIHDATMPAGAEPRNTDEMKNH